MYHYESINGVRTGHIKTVHGNIPLPAFFPVTTYGDKYPLDKLVQPYLKRLSPCIMVSYHYAQQMKVRPELPVFIDSGGFTGLFEGSTIEEHDGFACIKTRDGVELHPLRVLEFQEQNADLGATLDFIIPPGTEQAEAERRQRLTIQNALYAKEHQTSQDLFLYASLQCWDARSARNCAAIYAEAGFQGIAIGGLVPRSKNADYMKEVVKAVREAAPNCAIHVFGCGNAELLPDLYALGADSFDSSSYVRGAVSDKSLTAGLHANLYAALQKLYATNATLSATHSPMKEMVPNLELIVHS